MRALAASARAVGCGAGGYRGGKQGEEAMKCKIIDGSSWADLEKKVDAWLKKEKPSKVHLFETHNGKSIWLHRCISEYSHRTTATKGGGK
jgi:hypothetical protein